MTRALSDSCCKSAAVMCVHAVTVMTVADAIQGHSVWLWCASSLLLVCPGTLISLAPHLPA